MNKIDKFVFLVGIICTIFIVLMILVSLITRNIKLLEIADYSYSILGIFVFIRFLNDSRYKLKYYIGCAICNLVLGTIFKVFIQEFSVNMSNMTLTISIIGVINSYFTALFFQIFKEMSYRKNTLQ